MDMRDAQKQMRFAFVSGAPGALVSGLVWIIAGLIAKFHSFQFSILALFFGGMLIHPLSILISSQVNKSKTDTKDNPFVKLALEGTIFLFVGLFIAFTLSRSRPELFYPIMLLIIGARHLTFQTIYGLKTYWILGGVLLALGVFFVQQSTIPTYLVAMAGGIVEVLFAFYLFKGNKKPTH